MNKAVLVLAHGGTRELNGRFILIEESDDETQLGAVSWWRNGLEKTNCIFGSLDEVVKTLAADTKRVLPRKRESR